MAAAPIDLILLRGGFAPDLPLRVGDVLAARVLTREGPTGMLFLAGARVSARLPADLAPGARLRLQVQEAEGERVVLRVVGGGSEAAAPAAQAAAAADALAEALRRGLVATLPGGASARLFVDPGEGGAAPAGGRAPSRVTLRFEAAALGRVDVALELAPGAVSGTVHAPAGDVAQRLRAGIGDLRDALAQATGRPATVAVRERGETVDLRA
ncbi:MAG: flagellar hook-length control protein FliK [Solirubrobacteraceae bacterium]|nr:flagellar hook-length control protein FliK [Solirubrobacteraceae bacterium]